MYFAATRDDPQEHFEAVRSAVARVDPEQPVTHLRSLDQVMSDDYAGASLGSGALEAFGIVAVALAGIGVYSLLAYSVSRRRRELAIRVALGATRRDLVGMVLRQGLRVTLLGVVLGVGAALFLCRGLTTLLPRRRSFRSAHLRGGSARDRHRDDGGQLPARPPRIAR